MMRNIHEVNMSFLFNTFWKFISSENWSSKLKCKIMSVILILFLIMQLDNYYYFVLDIYYNHDCYWPLIWEVKMRAIKSLWKVFSWIFFRCVLTIMTWIQISVAQFLSITLSINANGNDKSQTWKHPGYIK